MVIWDNKEYSSGFRKAESDIREYGLSEVLRIVSDFDHDQSPNAVGYRTAIALAQERQSN